MKYWLMKSEPDEYGWEDLKKDKKTFWYGVRSYPARKNLMAMQIGDLAFFYHSNIGKEIVGVMKINSLAYPDAKATDGKGWVGVDVIPVLELANTVKLSTLRTLEEFSTMQLLTRSRLSVSEVSVEHFQKILKIGGIENKLIV